MFIDSLYLEKYVPFTYGDIDTFEGVFTSPIQIIIGTNGSGKSTLVRQMNPLPPPRSDFEEGGKKKLTLTHKGSTYVLESDFENKAGAHSFKKDDEELNQSGTTGVQAELVSTHLGFTPTTFAIMFGKYKLSQMGPSQRRAFLMDVNPCKIGFILDAHKKASSQVKARKSILTRLHERKALLEADLMDASVVSLMREESHTLKERISTYISFEGQISTLDHAIGDVGPLPDINDYLKRLQEELTRIEREVYPKLGYVYYLGDTIMAERRAKFSAELEWLKRDQKERMESEIDLLTEIHRIEDNLASMTDAEHEQVEMMKILTLNASREDIGRRAENPLSPEEIKDAYAILPTLTALLTRFTSYDVIYPRQTIARKRSKVAYWYRKAALWSDQIEAKEHELNQIRPSSITMDQIPTQNCARNACPLFTHFSTAITKKAERKEELIKTIQQLTRKKERAEAYATEQVNKITAHEDVERDLTELSTLTQDCSGLRRIMRGMDVILVLSTSAMQIQKKLSTLVKESENVHEYNRLSAEIEKESLALSHKKSLGKKEREVMEAHLATLKSTCKKHREEYETTVKRIADLSRDIARIDLVVSAHTQLRSLEAESRLIEMQSRGIYQRDLYRSILQTLEGLRSDAIQRLGQIDATLREQDSIRDRYEKEVVEEIEKAQNEKIAWEHLEKSLSRIPHLYSVTFLNDIIASMNAFISKVFTYPFKVLPVDINETLTYRFKIKNKGKLVPDVSDCSDAQIEMLDLAFNLALRRSLKLTDYPIVLDEVGKTFDPVHKQKLLDLLRYLTENEIVSQMFLINHHAAIHEGLVHGETLVMDPANVVVPMVYNEHVTFNG